MTEARVLSIQVGLPRHMGSADAAESDDSAWFSGIFKDAVQGPLALGPRNLAGDAQADLKNHGTVDQAVLLYAAAHYPVWRKTLGLPEMAHGAFGENFTVAGLDEAQVCIGDIYAIGGALVQVSQPRAPCWKLARRNRVADLHLQVQRTGWGGWYVRVLQPGEVGAGLPLTLVERTFPQWTITRVNDVLYRREPNPTVRAELATCPYLAATWRTRFGDAEVGTDQDT